MLVASSQKLTRLLPPVRALQQARYRMVRLSSLRVRPSLPCALEVRMTLTGSVAMRRDIAVTIAWTVGDCMQFSGVTCAPE